VKLVRKPELWLRVVFRAEFARAGMTTIFEALIPTFASAGCPESAEIWHKITGAGDDIYFFSPAIAELIPDELKAVGAVAASLPKLKPGFKKVAF